MSNTVTFRDFAGSIMGGDIDSAAGHLETLLGVDAAGAKAAASHFKSQMDAQGQPFMMKAMGLRTALSGGESELVVLMSELFGLSGDAAASSVAKLRATYTA